MNRTAPITPNLIAVKGGAKTSAPTPLPNTEIEAPAIPAAKVKPLKEREQPLNFSVPASWKKRFAQAALNEDMKHKEFLFSLFEAYENRIKGR